MRRVTRDEWHAPVAAGAVHGAVRVPASKSVTNRALLMAGLATTPSRLANPLRSRDTDLMIGALQALGITVGDQGGDIDVVPAPLQGPARIDVGLAGTVMRFVTAAATLASGKIFIDGDLRARERPIAPLLDALDSLGATIESADGSLPLWVLGHGGLRGGAATIDASASSQFVSALLIPAARFTEGLRLTHVGARPVPNSPHVRMTVAMLRDRGVLVDDSPNRWEVRPGDLAGGDRTIEPDLSTAAPFLAAAVVTGGEVTVRDWPVDSTQPGAMLPELLSAFGATSTYDGNGLTVRGPGEVVGASLDLRDAGELTPVLAAVAAVASGPTTLTGIGYLRGHETDRLAALAAELGGLGATVVEDDDGLTIRPGRLRGGVFHTYDDHRLAMAGAVLGIVVPGVRIENVATTAKTFPGFADAWLEFVTGGDT